MTLALVACGESSVTDNAVPSVPFGVSVEGTATYYAADGSGACSFDPSPDDLAVTALNQPDWSGSSLCGACAEVAGPRGSIRVRIVDLCPECPSGHLDLSESAFARIAEPSLGRVSITWQLVPCDVTGPVRYRYKDGSNPWWTAVQVHNHRLPVTAMEFSTDGTKFTEMVRTDYNYFFAESGFGDTAVAVRITSLDGQTLLDELPPVEELLVVAGKSQFL